MAEEQTDRQRNSSNNVAKWAVLATIVAALITATATIGATLLQRDDAAPATPSTTPPSRKLFDEFALEGEHGVMKILIDDYGVPAGQIERVDCPGGEEVKAGNTFVCFVHLDGGDPAGKVVDITVVDGSGEYQVNEPRNR